MENRSKLKTAIVMVGLLLMALLVLLTGCVEEPSVRAVRERISIESKDDCYIKNGSDLILYSNDLLSETLHLYGDSGNLYSSGIITATTLVTSYTDGTFSGQIYGDSNIWVADAYASGGVTANTGVITTTLAVGGDATGSADVVTGLFGRYTAQTCQAVTNGCTITPTGTYQPISCTIAAAVGFSGLTPTTAGDLLILTNVCTQSITLSDTGTTMLNASRVISQYDSLTLLCDGTNWIELSFTDN